MKNDKRAATVLAPMALVGLAAIPAGAQEAQESTKEESSRDSLALEEVVVTGVATGSQRKFDASFAISTLNASQIAEFAPLHVGDLLNAAPGVLAENTGGETGTNTFVRGFAQNSGSGFVTIQLNGLPIYPTSVSGFIENSALFRLDESIERMEALRGGSAVLLSNAQPGVTFNFLQKKGGPDLEGAAKISVSDYGMRRVDFIQSGPINDRTFYSFGGFYRTSPGLRDAQYEGDYGGQVDLQLTRLVDDGEINVWARHTDDNDNWYLPIPVRIGADNKSVSAFPGFDIYHGTYQGNDNRFGVIETGIHGETLALDSKDGRDVKLDIVGASFDKDLGGGWSLSTKAGVTDGVGGLTGPVGSGNPQTLQSFIDSTLATANANSAVVAAAGGPATGVTGLRFSGSGAAITDTSIQVMPVDLWHVNLEFTSFVADVRVAKHFENNKVIIGSYFSDETYKDEWSLGNARLMTATPNGRRIDLMLNNGVDVSRDGFIGAAFFSRNIAVDTRSWAAFLLDEWQITPKLRLEAGVRYEDREYNGTQQGATSGADLDGNPLTLYDNNASYLNGSYSPVSFQDDKISTTAAANYELTDSLSTFARASFGARFPDPDNIVNGQLLTEQVDQYELGIKAAYDKFSLFTTLFYNELSDVPFFQVIGTDIVLSSSGSKAHGVEIEADVRPFNSFNISLMATYVHSELTGGLNPGAKLFRQPDYVTRVSPKYLFNAVGMRGAVYGAVTSYFGDRFSDIPNQQPLASYTEVGLGTYLNVTDNITVNLSADNLFNEIGLTERNPRAAGTGVTSDVTLGRPIFGRSVRASFEYRF